VLLFDYAGTTGSMADRPMGEWLRTYRGHERAGDPLEGPGTRDVTVDVALDQLPSGALVASQADWLRANGLDDLVAAARRTWEERAGVGDLAAIRARSVPIEAEALCDPSGLGGFAALEWKAGTPP
jgi:SAM-dependent MidA family methyltransferase